MVVEPVECEQASTSRAARAWYAAHRGDVLAHLADPPSTTGVRSAELLALALDDDPGVVARSRVVRDAWRSSSTSGDLRHRPDGAPRQAVREYDRATRSAEAPRSSRSTASVLPLG